MAAIHTLTAAPAEPRLVAHAQHLFREYARFLQAIPACVHTFNFTRFASEILTLPAPYTNAHGELLLALDDLGQPLGCIAFRAAAPTMGPDTCEIKRLFVLPSARGLGLAQQLIRASLSHAARLGYRTAILDTEPTSMHAAFALYRKLGFTPFEPHQPENPVAVVYLRRSIPEPLHQPPDSIPNPHLV